MSAFLNPFVPIEHTYKSQVVMTRFAKPMKKCTSKPINVNWFSGWPNVVDLSTVRLDLTPKRKVKGEGKRKRQGYSVNL